MGWRIRVPTSCLYYIYEFVHHTFYSYYVHYSRILGRIHEIRTSVLNRQNRHPEEHNRIQISYIITFQWVYNSTQSSSVVVRGKCCFQYCQCQCSRTGTHATSVESLRQGFFTFVSGDVYYGSRKLVALKMSAPDK